MGEEVTVKLIAQVEVNCPSNQAARAISSQLDMVENAQIDITGETLFYSNPGEYDAQVLEKDVLGAITRVGLSS